jgi:uroporphyrinogen-III decarboxylase
MHCCGGIAPLLDAVVEAEFDILNPVQCSAKGMDPRALKRDYGDQLVFWGGGVDTQKTLPFGKPQEVRDEVRERIEIFGPGGGFVFCTIHNIQANTPIENVLAMFEVVKEYHRRFAARGRSGVAADIFVRAPLVIRLDRMR